MRTLIKNIDILTMDDNQTRYENACILIEDDEIRFVGNLSDLQADIQYDKIEDGEGKLALPGLINTHTHVAMTLFRGYANDLPLMEWLSQKIWPVEDRLSEGDAYWLSLLAMAEMIRGGVTTFADMYMFMEETALAVEQSGMRGVLARGLQGPDEKSGLRLEENRRLWQNWQGRGNGRIRVMVGPHAIYTCQPSFLLESKELAQELEVGIHIHLSETGKEVEDSKKKYGKSPVRHLYDLGLLDGHVLAAHCVHLSEEDMDILEEKDVKVAHCPASNLKLGSGIAPIADMIKRGITVSLGTDGAASNNNLSIMKEMSLAGLISKGIKEEPTLIPAITSLQMATYNGAKALALEDSVGSLAPGKKADIILINTQQPHYYPHTDWANHLVYSGYSSDIDSVWVNGKKLMDNRELLTIDLDKVYFEVNKIYKRIMEE
ncbi:MAG: amidohydrolase [Clostridiales bacterium]|nr:amidohydrolase [Clostridiales bacterium]